MNERFEKGMKIKEEVLGKEIVDNSLEKISEFNAPLYNLITEYCWGEIWAREELDKKTRSLLNLAMLTALNRPNELKLHTKGALRNGCTKEEIREVFLQTMIYIGVPAAVDSFRIASEVINEGNK